MNQETTDAVFAHALADYPRESCGLIIIEAGKEIYVPCANVAETPSEHFKIAPQQYAEIEDRGEVIACVHSHPNLPARPSEADRVQCENSSIEWIIVSVMPGEEGAPPFILGSYSITPVGYVAPLVGREFSFGVLDCYTLVRDWYKRALGIELKNYARNDDFWVNGTSLYLDHYAEAGFAKLDPATTELQIGDIILMQIRAKVPNHAAVYIGDGLILQHLYGRLSSRDVYGGMWKEKTTHILRKVS